MTAPALATPTTTAPAPAALPTSMPETGGGESFQSRLDSIIKTAPLPSGEESPRGIPAGGVSGPTTGTTETEQAPSAEPGPTDGVPPTTAPVEPTGPQGEVTVDNGDVVLTAERNADGTFKTQIDPSQKFDIKIRDAETGETKVYSKTIPEVLRMAKDGVWGQKVRDEVSYYRINVPRWQEEHQTLSTTTAALRAQLDAQMQLNRELLTADEALVVARREEFAMEMSPEKRLARMEAELAQREAAQRQTEQEQALTRQVTDFANARLAPAVTHAVALVGDQRAKEMLAYEMLPFQVNGKVPPEQLERLANHLNGPFMERVKAEAVSKAAPDPKLAQLEEAARAARAEAQRIANATGRAMSPVSNLANTGTDTPKAVAPPKNVNEAIDRIVSRPLMAQSGAH